MGYLILHMKPGDRLLIGDDVVIEMKRSQGKSVRVCCMGPPHISFLRETAIVKKKKPPLSHMIPTEADK